MPRIILFLFIGLVSSVSGLATLPHPTLKPYRTLRLVPQSDDETSSLHAAHMCNWLSPEDAAWMVTEAESFSAKRGGWSTDRHGQFPTTDFAVEACPTLNRHLQPRLQEQVLPLLAELYGLKAHDLDIDDLFFVKYEAGKQASLGAHYDDTLLSFSALLADPSSFDGGGTHFPTSLWVEEEVDTGNGNAIAVADSKSRRRAKKSTTRTLQPQSIGDLVVHCGRLTHSGLAVTSGLRYLLVGFVRVYGSRVDHGAYDEFLKGKGRLAHAKHLASHRKLAETMNGVAARGAPAYQAAAQAQLEYEYAARALTGADSEDDGIERPPEFTIL